jgi:hypothetical protein
MALETLTKAFEQSQIKKRPGSFGRTLEYIPANEVIKRLIEAGAWNCRIVKEVISDDEVAVLIELEIDGSKRQQWGGKQRKGVSLADALKAATSDGIKKTATLFGVALELHGEDTEDESPTFPKNTGIIRNWQPSKKEAY